MIFLPCLHGRGYIQGSMVSAKFTNRRTPNKRSAEKIEIVVAALDLAPNQLSKDLFLKLKGLGRGQTAAGQKAG